MTATSVALLGVGKMGAAFVDRWRSAGREVVLWNRTAAAAESLAGDGVLVASSAAGATSSSPFVVTMLTNGDAVRSVLLEGGALAAMAPGSTLIDLSTIDVPSSEVVAAAAKMRGVHYVRGGERHPAGGAERQRLAPPLGSDSRNRYGEAGARRDSPRPVSGR